MRTDEGDEIIEPGDYDLDGKTLRVYLTQDEEGDRTMWACTHCQEVDGITNGLLLNVIDGTLLTTQDESGEFNFQMTEAGKDRVKSMLGEPE